MKSYNLLLFTLLFILSIFACDNKTSITEEQKDQIIENTIQQSEIEAIEEEVAEPVEIENLTSNNKPPTKPQSTISKKINKEKSSKSSSAETEKTTVFEFPQFGGGMGSGQPKTVYEMAFRPQKTQEFKVSHKEVKTIYGEQGTSITIYPNSFVYENSGEEVKESITIKLQEYYKLSDILKTQLTTQTTKGEMLETAGMIHIEAFANGQKLVLKDGKSVDIGFPYEQFNNGMELFEGVKNDNKPILWEALNIEPQETDEIFQVVERMPMFKACDVGLTYEEREACTQRQLQNFVHQRARYPALARENAVQGNVIIRFVIEKDGSVSNVEIMKDPGAGTGEEAARVIGLLPDFEPGYQYGKPVRVQYHFHVRFRLENDFMNDERFNNPLDSGILNQNFKDNSTINNAQKAEMERYIFSSTALGWLNCDVFYRMKASKKTQLLVNKSMKQKGEVLLIFHSMKSVMSRSASTFGKASFRSIPKGEKVTLFALDFKMGKFYVAKQETTLTPNLNIDLNFEEVTLVKLDELMNDFDELF